MSKKSQQGIALIWLVITGTLLVTSVGMVTSRRRAQRLTETQFETLSPTLTPTPQLSPLPTPSPTLTPGQISEKKKELDQSVQKLIDQISAWTGGGGPTVDIQKQIQDQVAKDMAELKKTLSEMPSLGKQPEYPGSGYSAPSVEVFNFDSEKFDKAVMESINEIKKQTDEEMKKHLDEINKQAEEEMKSKQIDPKKIEEYFKQNPPAVPGVKSPREQEIEKLEEILDVELE